MNTILFIMNHCHNYCKIIRAINQIQKCMFTVLNTNLSSQDILFFIGLEMGFIKSMLNIPCNKFPAYRAINTSNKNFCWIISPLHRQKLILASTKAQPIWDLLITYHLLWFYSHVQKAYKRGLSVKKGKKNREYTSMKSIGVKSVDETFKVFVYKCKFIKKSWYQHGILQANIEFF